MANRLYTLVVFCIALLVASSVSAQQIELKPGSHISIIGNTLADRMQHDCWLESYLHQQFPKHKLVIRNLGFSGDEINLRLRSRDFGSPKKHLTENKTDVVMMMFGYNESFAGQKGLANFKNRLAKEINKHQKTKYNGASPPQVVVVSPIPHENLRQPAVTRGALNNSRLRLYTDAMREVAAKNKVAFVDLFGSMKAAYEQTEAPLTINGIHLNNEGNRLAAIEILKSLFGSSPETKDATKAIRSAVAKKNFYWYNLYRTTDGYSIFGGRADLRFTDGQTNREVMDREMEILRLMTENRDKAVWGVAQGKPFQVDDSNLPEFVPVVSNKPGTGPDGEHVFLSGEKAAEQMRMLEGFQVNLFASEEQFPELINPVQMAFDTRGRLFVAAWETYPHWKPRTEMNDKLLILEDLNGDGKADNCKTFADKLHNPTGFEFWGGGVFVAMGPEILFLKDNDGDDVADERRIVLHGLDTADTHHTANSFTIGPGGGLFFQEGTFHHTQVETPYGPTVRSANGAVFRYDPRSFEFIVYTPKTYANPHGHVFDRWGQDIIHDGTGAVPYDGALISSHLNFPNKHGSAPTVYQQRTRPLPATEVLSSRHFPDEMQDELLVLNVIGDLGILRYKIRNEGSSLVGEELEPLLLSDDQNFRPVDCEIGPRGAVFFTDWANPIIGHMQHNLRDPNRDNKHGRVYRITHKDRPLGDREEIADVRLPSLMQNLTLRDNRIRYRTRLELSARPTAEVIAAVSQWVSTLDQNHPDYEAFLLEALWIHQQHHKVNVSLLSKLLEAKEFRARAAATRVLCYWRNKLSDSAQRLLSQAADESPRVRLEALRAASFLKANEGLPILIEVFNHPTDKYIDWLTKEVIRAFPNWKEVLLKRKLLRGANEVATRFFLDRLSPAEIARVEPSKPVCEHLIFREGVGKDVRFESIKTLAEFNNVDTVRQLIESLKQIDPVKTNQATTNDLIQILSERTSDELRNVRDDLESIATTSSIPTLRKIGLLGLLGIDRDVHKVWESTSDNLTARLDLVSAIPMISDPELQTQLYPLVTPLLKNGNGSPTTVGGVQGQIVRIELPGRKRTLTLAEVEVFADGVNVSKGKLASQSTTAHGGVAERGIDGKKPAIFAAGGQSHTRENRRNPWWEVDLGKPFEIEEIRIYNRQESFGKRLDGFTLKVLDDRRQTVFIKKDIPAPAPNSSFKIGSTPPDVKLRRAAMDAISQVRGKESEAFELLSNFIDNDIDMAFAAQAAQRIPVRFWKQDKAQSLTDTLLKRLRSTPANQRNSDSTANISEFAGSLATMLPPEKAKLVLSEVEDLGVATIKLGTKPHRMAYDKETIIIKAGKAVEMIFENTDMMPHNLVLTKPGTMEKIGTMAEQQASSKGKQSGAFVPDTDDVLMSTKLIQPGENQRLSFQVPSEPGVYPYVCTYPGHWRRMFGMLLVVKDPVACKANPQAYLSENNLEIKDELLKLVMRNKTEWSLEDFTNSFDGDENEFVSARSFNTGRQMFKLASCISCHKMKGEGYEIGPDLTKDLDPKWTAKDVLNSMLEPSEKIDEQYRSRIIALATGETVSGIVIFEDDHFLKLVENPLVATEYKAIPKEDIDDEKVSDISIMPKGLLDTLSRSEVLDLVAYIVAKGDPEHHLFKDGDHGEH